MPFAGGTVPGAQPPAAVVDGAQFTVPSGAGVAAGVVLFAGVVVSVEGAGAGVVVLGVTTPGVIAPGVTVVTPGVLVAEGVAAVLPVAACAPAATAVSIVHAMAKQAIARKAPPCRWSDCGVFMYAVPYPRARKSARASIIGNVKGVAVVSFRSVRQKKKRPQRVCRGR